MNKCQTKDFQEQLEDAFDNLMELMKLSDYGGKYVYYKNGWKIKAWITKKDLQKQRDNVEEKTDA